VKIVDKSVVKQSIDCILCTPCRGQEKEAELVKATPPKICLMRGQKVVQVVMSRRCCIIILMTKKRRRDSRGKAVGGNVGTSLQSRRQKLRAVTRDPFQELASKLMDLANK